MTARNYFRCLIATALCSALASPIFAQETAPAAEAAPAEEPAAATDYTGIEEIVVTSTRRAASVQDIPIAVTAISSEGLAARGIADVKELQQVAPSLTVTDSNSTTNGGTIRIRGMGTSGNNPGLESAVGSFIDGVYRSRSGLALQDLVDVERVEILRGPQGTLFGKNTSAGLIHIITKQPEFDWGGYVRGSLGNFDLRKVEASVTGPLVDEKLAFRLAGTYHARDGYYHDIDTNDTFADRDRWALKGQFLWTPTDSFDARVIADYTKMREHCCPAVETTVGENGVLLQGLGAVFPNPSNKNTLDVGTNTDPVENVDDWGIQIEANWDLEWTKLKTLFAHRQTSIFRAQDVDFTNVDVLQPTNVDEDWKNWSLELQAGGDVETLKLDWLVGFYGYLESLDNAGQVRLGAAAGQYIGQQVARRVFLPNFASRFNAGEGRGSVFQQDTKGWSLFTHDIFHLTERLNFTVGARYGWERKDGSGIHDGAAPGRLASAPFCDQITRGNTPLQNAIAQQLVGLRNTLSNVCDNFSWADSFTKQNWSATVQLGFAITEDINAYASVSRGYKAGGFNLDSDAFNCEAAQIDDLGDPGPHPVTGVAAVQSGAFPGGGVYCYPTDSTKFGPESSLNYELGLKSQFFDGRLVANAAVFWTDFKGFQLNQFTGLGFIIRNVSKVQARGAELELTAYPAEGVIGNFSVTYADTRYGDDANVCFELQRPDLSVNRCPNNATTGGLDTPPGGGDPVANVFPRDQFADGHRITQSPAWSGSLGLSIQKPLLGTGWFWYGGGNLYYRGRHKTSSDLDPLKAQDAYIKLNLQAGIKTPDQRFDIQAWATNVTNEIVTSVYFDSGFQGGSVSAFRQSPRMYGVTATYHFGEN